GSVGRVAQSIDARAIPINGSDFTRSLGQSADAQLVDRARRTNIDCADRRTLRDRYLSDYFRSRRRTGNLHADRTRRALGSSKVLCEFEWVEIKVSSLRFHVSSSLIIVKPET